MPQASEVFSIASSLISALSTTFLAIVAVYGLRQWRSELRYAAKIEVARNGHVSSSIQCRIQSARSPFTFAYEYAGREKRDDELPEESGTLDEGHARYERLKPLVQILIKLREASWEAEIVLGQDYDELINQHEAVYRKLYGAVVTYFRPNYSRARATDKTWSIWMKDAHHL
jgi:hypothetical protein